MARTEQLSVPQGVFALARHPNRKNEQLRAWDAADELLLRYLAGDRTMLAAEGEAAEPVAAPSPGPVPLGTVLIVNDAWGALTTALADRRPAVLGDSYVAQASVVENLTRNKIAADQIHVLRDDGGDSLEGLDRDECFDLVVVKVPKTLSLLEQQLRRVRPLLRAGATVVGAAMAKHVHTSTIELFTSVLGPTRTSLAQRKARLLLCTPDPATPLNAPSWPRTYTLQPGGHVVTSHAGVFSAERLDLGTRFFLEHLPVGVGPESIVDLGCGNGVVGTMAALANPLADVVFVDDSPLAVASAKATFRANLGTGRAATFAVGNNLLDLDDGVVIEAGSVDTVLNNPPFHIDQAVGDAIAWDMFQESKQVLRVGGALWVVGNRHLAYHAKLKRLFGNCDVVAANAKFVVLRSERR